LSNNYFQKILPRFFKGKYVSFFKMITTTFGRTSFWCNTQKLTTGMQAISKSIQRVGYAKTY